LEERWPSDETGRVMDAAAQLEGLAAARRARTFRAVAKLALLVMVAAAVVGFLEVPTLNAPVMVRVLGREVPRLPTPVRVYAVRQLGRPGASDAAVLELARVANTADPEYEAALADAALAALEATAEQPFAGEDPIERLRAANGWAAERLGRELDANGGVLTWYPPVARFAAAIERVASSDPNDGWMSWSGFGLGDFRSSRDFAAAVGSGLTDPRPISFAIKRGSFLFGPTEDGPAFEGQPEPIAEHADQVLVHTVGGALALRMWEYDDVPGDTLPDDFVAWWRDFAAARLYPPLPEP
ncbi:MAG: hypothetical protein KDC48_14510, partial [Planctomycetes bacterium]|nr:hypothetical protein [Planctomycetota bacterium]